MDSIQTNTGTDLKVHRLHKYALNVAVLVSIVSMSMGAAAPTRSEYANEPSPLLQVAANASLKHSGPLAVGKASWYGEDFDGKETASGEPYNMYELTAAHRTLPLGSWVKVTNLKNHLWVLVRINDRGPVPTDRIIDLSYSAARMLHMSGRGLAPVRLDVVQAPEDDSSDIAMLSSNQ